MPYIRQESRDRVDPQIDSLIKVLREEDYHVGVLNYSISRLVNSALNDGPSYQRINDLVGVLDCVKAEFYRRRAVPYEEDKIKENGDLR